MSFRNSYDPVPRIASVTSSNQFLNLNWLTTTGRTYRLEASTNFANWSAVSSDLLAATTNQSWSAPRNGPRQFFRVQRLP